MGFTVIFLAMFVHEIITSVLKCAIFCTEGISCLRSDIVLN